MFKSSFHYHVTREIQNKMKLFRNKCFGVDGIMTKILVNVPFGTDFAYRKRIRIATIFINISFPAIIIISVGEIAQPSTTFLLLILTLLRQRKINFLVTEKVVKVFCCFKIFDRQINCHRSQKNFFNI